MAYPKSTLRKALIYLEQGHSIRDTARKFKVSVSCAAKWRKKAFGASRSQRPHPVEYPQETVRMALGLAYGGHGFRLDQVACMMGVSAPTISNWKKRYIEGGIWISLRSTLKTLGTLILKTWSA